MSKTSEPYVTNETLSFFQSNIKQIALDLGAPKNEVDRGKVSCVFGHVGRAKLLPRINLTKGRPATSNIENTMKGSYLATKDCVSKLRNFCTANFSNFELKCPESEDPDIIPIEKLTVEHLVMHKIHRFQRIPWTYDLEGPATIDRFRHPFVGFYKNADSGCIEMMAFRIFIKEGKPQCILVMGLNKTIDHKMIFCTTKYKKPIIDHLAEMTTIDEQFFNDAKRRSADFAKNFKAYLGEVQLNRDFLSFNLTEIPQADQTPTQNILSCIISISQYSHYLAQIDDSGKYLGGSGIALESVNQRAFPFVFVLYGTYDASPSMNLEKTQEKFIANHLVDCMLRHSIDTEIGKFREKILLQHEGGNLFKMCCHPADIERLWYPILCSARDTIKAKEKQEEAKRKERQKKKASNSD